MTRMSPDGRLNTPRPAPGPFLASPADGMFSTPSDLARVLTAVFSGSLLSKATVAVLITPRPDPAGGPGVVGYGFVIRQTPTPKVGIGGGAPCVNADLAYFPDSGWRLVALSNVDPPVATQMNRVLERAVFSEHATAACAAALYDPKLRTPPVVLVAPGGGRDAQVTPPPRRSPRYPRPQREARPRALAVSPV